MPFAHWSAYDELFTGMWLKKEAWKGAESFSELDEAIRGQCPELVGGNDASTVGGHGFAALCDDIAGDYPDENAKAQRIALLGLSRPAAQYGLTDPGWDGYYVSEHPPGTLIWTHLNDRFADVSQWEPVGGAPAHPEEESRPALTLDAETGLLYDDKSWYLEDGTTTVTEDPDNPGYFRDLTGGFYLKGKPADLTVSLFDRSTGRWRRLDRASNVFEYHHDSDDEWERRDESGEWLRRHDRVGQWLRYNALSQTYLYGNKWFSYDQIGAESAGEIGAAALAAQPEAESADGAEVEVAAAADVEFKQLAHRVREGRNEAVRLLIEDIRALNLSAQDLSDEAVAELFDEEMLAELG